MKTNLMIDIETLGIKSTSVICSIGVCVFDIMNENIINSYYIILDQKEQIQKYNRTIDIDTIHWWMTQQDNVRNELLKKHTTTFANSIENFIKFINTYISNNEYNIWMKGPKFDASILENAIKMLSFDIPWKYSNLKDVRTIQELIMEFSLFPISENENLHNALSDAIHQAKYVSKFYQYLNNSYRNKTNIY